MAKVLIGVTTYQLYPQPPAEYQNLLPTEEDWQRLLASAREADKNRADSVPSQLLYTPSHENDLASDPETTR